MKFSVVIPLYNKECYVARAIRSVFAQTYDDYELVVVDDGSSDGSLEVVQKEMEGRAGCRVVSQNNSGVARARNHGVEMSRGEYICFLDADDWWESTFLEEMERLVLVCPDAGLYGTSFYLVKHGKRRVAPIGVERGFVEGYINYCQTYARTLCMPITSSSVAVPRQVFLSIGGFREGISLGEDFDLWIRIALRHRVALVNKPLANYFQDMPSSRRATRRLHNPTHHMLWNLDYLEEEEGRNADYKLLIDRLRASGLYRYYLSRQYHAEALNQLEKIDWSHIPQNTYRLYCSPLWWQRLRFGVRTRAAATKSALLRLKDLL